jgi:hypothetical protein
MFYCISTVVAIRTASQELPRVSVTATIAGYRPVSVGPEEAAFARLVVAKVHPESRERAKALLHASSRLAAFGSSLGLVLDPEVLFEASLIERFVLCSTSALSVSSRRTVRSNLRYLARRVPTVVPAGPVALPRSHAKAPYSPAQIDAYLALAKAQPTVAKTMALNGLICLGAGAGLVGRDLRHVRGSDVVARSGGLVVTIFGRAPRVVPVLPAYHGLLQASAAFFGEGYVTGGELAARHNVTTPLVSKLSGGRHLERLEVSRLRATWVANCAARIGLKAFMAAAGITCSQRLGDVVASLPLASEQEMVALLGATS